MLLCLLTMSVLFQGTAHAQENLGLKLVRTIPLPQLPGRFDHFIIDTNHNRLFITAQGTKTVEVLDLQSGKIVHSIPGFKSPHAGYYRADTNELLIGDDDGTSKVFRGNSFDLFKTIRLSLENSDGLRLDPVSRYVYVVNAYKEDNAKVDFSYLAIIDTRSWEHIGDIKFAGTHVEEVGLDPSGQRLFVDVVSRREVAVVDRVTLKQISTWPITVDGLPFGVVLDPARHRLFVGLRKPGTLVVLNSDTGKMVTSLSIKDVMDDMFYDSAHRQIYVSSGVKGSTEGFINVIKQADADHYTSEAVVATGGASPTSLFVPELNQLFVGVQQHGGKDAEIQIYVAE